MKILIATHQYFPIVGGVPVISRMLAEGLAARHQVRVMTGTPGGPEGSDRFELMRQPAWRDLLAAYRWCDVALLQGPSVRIGWPLLVLRKPYLLVHHIWLEGMNSHRVADILLRTILIRRGANVCVSRPIGEALHLPYQVIRNPYDSSVFRRFPGVARTRDLAYVGRLEQAKGVHILLGALACLNRQGIFPTLTIIGDGLEMNNLRRQCAESGLDPQVEFAGFLGGEAVAAALNRHRILVIPSVWAEPFGIVAIEGLACGCAVIGGNRGGLPDAIGSCGLTYPSDNVNALAAAIQEALTNPALVERLLDGAARHVAQFTRESVVAEYEAAMERLAGRAVC